MGLTYSKSLLECRDTVFVEQNKGITWKNALYAEIDDEFVCMAMMGYLQPTSIIEKGARPWHVNISTHFRTVGILNMSFIWCQKCHGIC